MAQATEFSHPYFPRDANIVNYEPNVDSLAFILGRFVGLIAVFVGSGLYLAKLFNSSLPRRELVAVAWFLLCKFVQNSMAMSA
jgi:cholestenol delta-isomerase